MEFELYERKFKLVYDNLFSYYKHGGRNQIERWHPVKISSGGKGYKHFTFSYKGKSKTLQYHRVLYYAHNNQWNLLDSSMENVIDHIDGDKTNNCISNLRVVTQQENQFNRKCKGYTFDKASGKYKAIIKLNQKSIHIGLFDTKEEAHQAYLEKKKELHVIIQR